MSGGLFDRWRAAPPPVVEPQALPAVGLQLLLDEQAQVLRLAGPLRTLLALPGRPGARLHDYLQRHSWLVIEGEPGDWQGQPLDLDFNTVVGHALHTRGWLQRHGQAWLLQLFDIGDLLREQRWDRQRPLLGEIGHALRECGAQRLAQTASAQLQVLAEHWQAASLRLMLREPNGWRHYASSDSTWPWPQDSRLQARLDSLPAATLLDVKDDVELQALCGGASLLLLPYRQGQDAEAWLLCAGATQVPEADMALALVGPWSSRCWPACGASSGSSSPRTSTNCSGSWGRGGGNGRHRGICNWIRHWPRRLPCRTRPALGNGWPACTRLTANPRSLRWHRPAKGTR